MKLLLVTTVFFLSFSAHALDFEYDVATVMGHADPSVKFVQRTVKESVVLNGNQDSREITTGLYDLLTRNGVEESINYEVFHNGTSSKTIILDALSRAAQKAKIVFAIVGPIDNDMCKLTLRHDNTVFVFLAGSSAQFMDPSRYMFCLNGNLLITAGLNRDLDGMASNSDYGEFVVSLAVPSQDDFCVTVSPAQTKCFQSKSFGAAVAVGRLAKTAKEFPNLTGTALAERFLADHTIELPGIVGYVRYGRALMEGDW